LLAHEESKLTEGGRFVDHAFQTFMYALVGSLTENVDELERYTGYMKAVNTGGAALGYAVQTQWSMVGAEALLSVDL
jgi:hypothetical protein